MTKEDIKKASTLAIRDHYNCNGKYPCSERDYCQYNNGKNTAYDCNECGADEFHEGFLIAAEWRINSVWHDARTEIPQENRFILVIHDDDNCTVRKLRGEISYCSLTWVRWAYIEDLIPNKED